MRKSAMNWTGHGGQLIGIHAMLGFLLVLSLWAIAAIAARSGVSIGLVARPSPTAWPSPSSLERRQLSP